MTSNTPWGYHTRMKSEVKNQLSRRLKIIEGQVKGLQRLVENDMYCIDVITQTSAVRQALSSIEDVMLKNHLSTHVIDQMKSGKHEKAVDEILSVYKISKRK